MLERDLKIISDYILQLKSDAQRQDQKELVEKAYTAIEELRSSVNSSPNLSITFPCPDTMKCTICNKTVVTQ